MRGEGAWQATPGVEVAEDVATVDFGDVRFGEVVTREVSLVNRGRGALRASVPAATAPYAGGGLEKALAATEAVTWTVSFTPEDDGVSARREFEARVEVTLEGGAAPATLTLRLRGRGYASRCALPASLDFGAVQVGEVGTVTFTLTNETPQAQTTQLFRAGGASGAAFSWQPEAQSVAPRTSADFFAHFAPTEARAWLAVAHGQVDATCPILPIELRGVGVTSLLEWAPAALDCGWVPVDAAARRTVTFHNHARQLATVRAFAATGPAEVYGVEAGLVVAPESSVQVEVGCRPTALGLQAGLISFETSQVSAPAGAIPVTVRGGGPQLTVMPEPLSYGQVAWSAVGAPPTTRRLWLRNVGTLPPDAGDDLNLHVTAVAFEERDGGVRAHDVAVALGAVPPGGISPGGALAVEVRLTPADEGLLRFGLRVESNDGVSPQRVVEAVATALEVPPCQLAVSPTGLDFGLLSGGEVRTQHVRLSNLDPASRCFLSAIDVEDDVVPTFSLVGGRVESLQLAASESVELEVQAVGWDFQGLRMGALRFEANTAGTTGQVVQLKAAHAPFCADVRPAPVDFGQVPVGCRVSRPAGVYNLCTGTQTVLGATVQCAGFSADAGEVTLGVAERAEVTVHFTPTSVGGTAGTLGVRLGNGTRHLALRGEGVPAGAVTESFVQRADTALDLLFVVHGNRGDTGEPFSPDASSYEYYEFYTMAGMQRYLRQLLLRLVEDGVDVRAGVIAGDWDQNATPFPTEVNRYWPMGALVRLPDGGQPVDGVVTGATPAAGERLNELVDDALSHFIVFRTGDSAAIFEAGVRAFEEPNVSGMNAGFRRPGVPLSLVGYTMRNDDSSRFRWDEYCLVYPGCEYLFPMSPLYYWELLSAATGRETTWSFVTRLPYYSCLPPRSGVIDRDARFRTMASRSGGVIVNLCEGADAGVEALRVATTASQRRFFLQGAPDAAAPFVVWVDAMPVDPAHFVYLPQLNAIELVTAPPPGASVEVRYFVACE